MNDPDPDVRFRAVLKLYSLGPAAREAVEPLIHLLDDPHLPTRGFAANVLGRIDPQSSSVVSALVARLNADQPASVKEQIVQTLGNSRTKEAIEALARALADADPRLRRYAAIALKLLGKHAEDAAPALQKLLETETDKDIRSQVTVALELMRD
jgi:HEAT repeat protein